MSLAISVSPPVVPTTTLQSIDRRLAAPGLVTGATLVVVLLATTDAWYVAAPVSVLAGAALVCPALRDRPLLWWALVGCLGAGVHQAWTTADNHQYLIIYWVLAVAFAAGSTDPARARAIAARWLLAAVFLLATVWKVSNPAFVDGSFFEFTLLTDPRFVPAASVLGGVETSDLALNRTVFDAMEGAGPGASIALLGHTARLALVADVLTVWTLAIEGAVALAFLRRGTSWLGRHRDHLLITFTATTYLAAPVLGFGWLLLVLGLAQVRGTRDHLRLLYVAAFVVVRIGATPLAELAARWA
jgi:hypothetical protein